MFLVFETDYFGFLDAFEMCEKWMCSVVSGHWHWIGQVWRRSGSLPIMLGRIGFGGQFNDSGSLEYSSSFFQSSLRIFLPLGTVAKSTEGVLCRKRCLDGHACFNVTTTEMPGIVMKAQCCSRVCNFDVVTDRCISQNSIPLKRHLAMFTWWQSCARFRPADICVSASSLVPTVVCTDQINAQSRQTGIYSLYGGVGG